MNLGIFPQSGLELKRHVQVRTCWRIRNLEIELSSERAILRGQATSLHARQRAEHALLDLLPHVCVENTIGVDPSTEIMHGMPMT